VSEEYLGAALSGRRDNVVIATKFGSMIAGDPQRAGASARWIVTAVEDSLRRLRTDRIDLYQQHFPDPAVEQEETLRALDELVAAGKIVHHGVCNLSVADVAQRQDLAARDGLAAPVSSQDRYNLLRQEARASLVPTLEHCHMALLPYFPLASGMLTGKYRAGEALPADSRFAKHLPPAQAARIVERDNDAVMRLAAWAEHRGRTVAELALAWLASQPVVGSVIAGVSKPEQVDANVRAVEWQLSADEVAEVARVALDEPMI
jgi:aryl-alcohol dehydrogenase-like predicted oxidoreductase